MTRKTQVKCCNGVGDSDERAEANGVELAEDTGCDAKVNVVASLQSVLAALKSASEFTSSGKSFTGGVLMLHVTYFSFIVWNLAFGAST